MPKSWSGFEHYYGDTLNGPLPVEEIADHVGVSRATLGRLFRKHMRRSIIDEIASNRLEKARELLAFGSPKPPFACLARRRRGKKITEVIRAANGFSPLLIVPRIHRFRKTS